MILETLLRRMATEEKGPMTGLKPGIYTLSWSFSHEPLVPAENSSSPITFCTGCRCAAIQRLLRAYTLRLVLCDVVVATPAYTELPTRMMRQRQLASSTTGSRVQATRWSPAEPNTTTSHSTSLKVLVSSRWIAAHLRPVQGR